MRSSIKLLWGAVALVAWMLLAGCSKTPSISQPVQPRMSFSAAMPSPGSNTVTMQSLSNSASTVTVSVRINASDPVVGVSFWITFDSSLAVLTTASEGDFFSRSGYMTAFLWSESSPGVLKISVTRLQTNGRFEGQTGEGELFQIAFSARGPAGSSSVEFSRTANRQVFISDPSNANIASRFQLAGGTITVTR